MNDNPGSKGKAEESENPSPESEAFEEGLRKILRTPKTEVEKRMAGERKKADPA